MLNDTDLNGVLFLIKLNALLGGFGVLRAQNTEFGFFFQTFDKSWHAVVDADAGSVVLYENVDPDEFDPTYDTPLSRYDTVNSLIDAYLRVLRPDPKRKIS